MKNRTRIFINLTVSFFLVSCMGLDEIDPATFDAPTVKDVEIIETGSDEDLGSLNFTLSAHVSSRLSNYSDCGFEYGLSQNFKDAKRVKASVSYSTMTASLEFKDYGKKIYVRAYLSNGADGSKYKEVYSEVGAITINELSSYVRFGYLGIVSHSPTDKKAVVNLSYKVASGVNVTATGMCYGPDENLDISDSHVEDTKITDRVIEVEVPEVTVGEKFYVRPYLRDGDAIAYGDVKAFTTYDVPEVKLVSVSEVGEESALLSAIVTNDGGREITRRGFVYSSESETPTVNDNVWGDRSGSEGEYSENITGLNPNTTYYVRAFAENDKGRAYSADVMNFTTLVAKPEVETISSDSVGSSSAVLKGEVVDYGGESSIECGFYISTTEAMSPEVSEREVCEISDDFFVFECSGLDDATTYYFQAFAKNSAGESLGDVMSFTTIAKPTISEALAIPDEAAVELEGVVVGVTARGFLISDAETDMLYVYAGEKWDKSVKIKDSVVVIGKMNTYHNVRELMMDSVSVTGTSELPSITATTLTEDNLSEFAKDTETPCKVEFKGDLTYDGTYYEVAIDDNPVVVSLEFPIKDLSSYVNEYVAVSGYYLWTKTSPASETVVSIAMTDIEITELPPPDPVDTSVAEDLNAGGETANSYIISKAGTYKFLAVKGNSFVSVGAVASAEVLWESFGISVAPEVGDLVEIAEYHDGSVYFRTSASFKEGNAVIAAIDTDGTILWSWHIWMTDTPVEQVYYNNAGTMMDRNLGATSATPGDVGALGLMYQWGRKDPFLGSSSISSNTTAASTLSWPYSVSSEDNGTIDYSVKHPTTYISSSEYDGANNNGDWLYTGDSSTDDTRWQSDKTIYDPCPAGWRVPDGGENGVWATATGSSESFNYTFDSTNYGMNFSGTLSDATTIWYPAAGRCFIGNGSLSMVGNVGYYMSVTSGNNSRAKGLFFDNVDVGPCGGAQRAYGRSVRCQKIDMNSSTADGYTQDIGNSEYEW